MDEAFRMELARIRAEVAKVVENKGWTEAARRQAAAGRLSRAAAQVRTVAKLFTAKGREANRAAKKQQQETHENYKKYLASLGVKAV